MASGNKKVIYAALIGNGLISITKFAAASMTRSSAMMAEGIHSLVDTGNQVLLLWGLKAAKKPASPRYPFGHGKEVYFWSFVVSLLIFAVGAGVSLYEGIHGVMNPHHMENVRINYIVLGLAIVFELGAWWMAFVEFRREKGNWGWFEAVRRGKDPTKFVVLFEDSAALLGLIVALGGIWLAQVTHNPIYDGAATILIGLILAFTAVWLAVETKGLLIGEAADPEMIEGIRGVVNAADEVESITELATLHMGPEYILLTLGVRFGAEVKAAQIPATIVRVETQIKREYPLVKRVFVEADPANLPKI